MLDKIWDYLLALYHDSMHGKLHKNVTIVEFSRSLVGAPEFSNERLNCCHFWKKEKSPTITVGSFFSAYILTLNGPLFLQSLQSYLTISYNSYLTNL